VYTLGVGKCLLRKRGKKEERNKGKQEETKREKGGEKEEIVK